MSRINYDGRKYHVWFDYSVGKKSGREALRTLQKNKDKKIKTTCFIEIKNEEAANQDEKYSIVGQGESVRNKEDVFRKVNGRAVSFARAIKLIPDRALRQAVAQQIIQDQGRAFILALSTHRKEIAWSSAAKNQEDKPDKHKALTRQTMH
jgi:hypothetical protein